MNPLRLSLLAALGLAGTVTAQTTSPIQQLTLDPLAVTHIPVARDRLTTIRFPSPVSDLQSALVAAEPHPEALFLVTFQPTSAFFSVRALVANTNTTLNVVWQNQTYVLELEESSSPWLSVILAAPTEPPPHPAPTNACPARPRDLIATARGLSLQRGQAQTRLPGVEIYHPGTTKDHFGYAVRVAGIYRFIAENTLVFHVGVSNKTPAVLQYITTNLIAIVDEQLYCLPLTQAEGTLPPNCEVPVYFSIPAGTNHTAGRFVPPDHVTVLFLSPCLANPSSSTAPPNPPPSGVVPTVRASGGPLRAHEATEPANAIIASGDYSRCPKWVDPVEPDPTRCNVKYPYQPPAHP